MNIIEVVKEIRSLSRDARQHGKRVGFVPTMGALHEGHLSLVRAARAQCDAVVVSIFVNPTQFGPHEDFSKYPRTFECDCRMLEKENVEFVFAPSVEEMYPSGALTFVTVEELSSRLCGKSRPGHFRGVTTIVSKLFHIIEPDVAFFGQKDAAQLAIIRRMVQDLNLPVQIVGCPIVREPDGLAMSSRNTYLNPQQRKSALVLSRALRQMDSRFHNGEHGSENLIQTGLQVFAEEPAVKLDYLEIVDPYTLESLRTIDQPALVAIAALVGSTRLIDNVLLHA